MADSVPVKKALKDGNRKAVLVLTRPRGYRKEPYGHPELARIWYRKYPKLANSIINRHQGYNRTMDLIDVMEDRGEIFVIRPERPIRSKMLNKDLADVEDHYNDGYAFMKKTEEDFKNYIDR